MAPGQRGRPRRQGVSRSGLGTQEDVLRAAARLFGEVGYGSTSTYAIAREAGVSQASMYHYFTGKPAVLLELLLRTVRPSVQAARRLEEMTAPADVRLWALCATDVELLVSGPSNIGALYLLPELYAAGDDQFAAFHEERARLRGIYRDLAREVLATADTGRRRPPLEGTADLVFGLVESVVLRRREEPHLRHEEVASAVADGVLRLLAVTGPRLERAAQEGARCARRLVVPPTAETGTTA